MRIFTIIARVTATRIAERDSRTWTDSRDGPRARVLCRARVVDLDLTVVFANLNVWEREQRLRELLMENIALERERCSVTRAIEASLGRVVAKEATLVRAYA
jgi:hypothetical protein